MTLRWQYLVKTIDAEFLASELDALGRDGWESAFVEKFTRLIKATYGVHDIPTERGYVRVTEIPVDAYHFIFKRQEEEKPC